jgi:predicted CoA-substrate-specific enzyme activase
VITLGIDVGSTTVKLVLLEDGAILWRDYRRHKTRQAETLLAMLEEAEAAGKLAPGRAAVGCTGSGAGLLARHLGARLLQEVVAVARAVERLHHEIRFVSEIGGEDMKTVFFGAAEAGRNRQVFMQSACSGGTGTFIEKTARKLGVAAETLATMDYHGLPLHRISSKCGIFAEADANTLVKSGVPVEEIMASLFDAVVHQNLATLTKGNTPLPPVLLLGGPNLFFKGLQQAWRHHLGRLWTERGLSSDAAAIEIPEDGLYYAALGCADFTAAEAAQFRYPGTADIKNWIREGQHREKLQAGRCGLTESAGDLDAFRARYQRAAAARSLPCAPAETPVVVGCDLGSTTAKAAVLARDGSLLFDCYALSKGNPLEDVQALFAQIDAAGWRDIRGLALTGYGKDLLKDVVGADLAVVETVAHAEAALHYVPDADVICDVGGCDVKIMVLRQGAVSDFRLNSQCSSGNGAFLQGVAERYEVALEDYADHAFSAAAMPSLAMGCGVFLQSDIVNQQRKGWSAGEIMAGLAAVLPLNVWVYAGQINNLAALGRRFVLQGGTHRNLAVVKAQVDFITAKVPEAEIVIHPHSGEAGAIGAALALGADWDWQRGSGFRGFDAIAAMQHRATTSEATVCRWCAVNCRRSFIDVKIAGAEGRPWSKVALEPDWQRVISGNSCPKGLVEDAAELRVVKARMEEQKRAHRNLAEMVRADAFNGRAVRARADR